MIGVATISLLPPAFLLATPFEQSRNNTGHEKWLQVLSRYELPGDSKTVLFELNRRVETLSRQLSKLLQSAQGLTSGCQYYSNAVVDFDHKFQDLLISEMISLNRVQVTENKQDSDGEENGAQGEENSPNELLVNSLRDLSFCATDWGNNVSKFSHIVDYFLLEALRFEHGLVAQVKELLKRRREVIKLHDKSVQKKIVHEREKKVAEHSGQLEQVNRLTRKITEDNERVRNTYDHAIFITKGLFFSGVRHFTKAKAKRLKKLKDTLCTAFKIYHTKMADIWEANLHAEEEPTLPTDSTPEMS